jgi:hypothetical protein
MQNTEFFNKPNLGAKMPNTRPSQHGNENHEEDFEEGNPENGQSESDRSSRSTDSQKDTHKGSVRQDQHKGGSMGGKEQNSHSKQSQHNHK